MTLGSTLFRKGRAQTQDVHSRISRNEALRWIGIPKIIEGATRVDYDCQVYSQGVILEDCRFFTGVTRHLVGNESTTVIFTIHRLHGLGSVAARYLSACGTTPSWGLEAVRLLGLVLQCLGITLE